MDDNRFGMDDLHFQEAVRLEQVEFLGEARGTRDIPVELGLPASVMIEEISGLSTVTIIPSSPKFLT